MLMFILPILNIILLAICLRIIVKTFINSDISIPNSIFIMMCIVIISLFLFGTMGHLDVGLIFIRTLSILAIIAIIVITIIYKNYKKLLTDLSSPIIIVLIFSCIVYFLVSKDKVFVYRDTATVWGYAARYMYLTNKIVALEHPSGMAFLNYFFLKTSYYSEGIMYLGRWFFMWVCILLPFKNNDKKDLWKLVLYSICAYAIMSIIIETQILYMDTPIGIITGSLFGYLLVNKNKGFKEIATVILGMGVVLLIKDEIGKIFTFFLAAIFFIELIIERRNKQSKFNFIQFIFIECTIAVFTIPVLTILLSDSLRSSFNDFLKVNYIVALIIGLLIIVAMIFIAIRLYRKSKNFINKDKKTVSNLKYYLIIIVAFLITIVVYKFISIYYSSLVYEDQNILSNAVRQLFKKGYCGKSLFVILGYSILLFIVAFKYMLNKTTRNLVARQGLMVLLFLLAYIFLLAVMYSKHIIGGSFAKDLVQMNRYLGAGVIVVIVWYVAFAFYDKLWMNRKIQTIAVVLIMLVLITEIPMPSAKMFSNRNNSMNLALTYTYRPEIRSNAEFIKANISPESKVFIITQPGKWSLEDEGAWMEYEMLPVESKAIAVYYGEKVFTGTLNSLGLTEDEFANMIKQDGYSHIYIYYADEFFIKDFGELFSIKGIEGEGILFEFTGSDFIEIGRMRN